MPFLLSLNAGKTTPTDHARTGFTGIDKKPVEGPVQVSAPGPRGVGGSGLAGDEISDLSDHGGDDQALYAYAREDLDLWSIELGRPLPPGAFGENLTTAGLDVSSVLIGEQWKIGAQVVVEVSSPRFPCRTFAHHLSENGWMRTFIHRAAPGAYLRVVRSGPLAAGDLISVVSRPKHDITVAIAFRALTLEPDLLPRLLTVDALPVKLVDRARRRLPGARACGP